MHSISFLQDFAVVMIVAGLVTLVCRRLGQPVILGYLVAGLIIGPHTPPYPLVKDLASIRMLAELGMVLLLFSIGLEFSLRKVKGVGPAVLVAAALESLLMVWVGYEVGRFLGWSPVSRIFLGAMLSISSTTIVMRNLQETGTGQERFSRVVLGILVVEDVLAVLFLAILSSIALTGSARAADLAGTAARLAAFLAAALVAGLLAVPRLLGYVGRFKMGETLLVTVLGLCFGASLLAVRIGYSAALGAFLAGAIVAETRQIGRVRSLVEPLRDMFGAIFFVAMGMLIDPAELVRHPLLVCSLSAAVILGKAAACSLGTFVAGHDLGTSLRVGMSLGQIGEFSFIIAALGSSLGVLAPFLYPVAACVAALTAFTSPYLTRNSGRLARNIQRRIPRAVLGYLELYSRWAARLGAAGSDSVIRAHLRRVAFQLFLNVSLIVVAFALAAYLARVDLSWLPEVPERWGGTRSLLWLVTMLAASPLYIATLRKVNAVAMLLAEMAVPQSLGRAHTSAVRSVMTATIFTAGALGLALVTMLLSAALLPPRNVFLVLMVILAAATFFLWNAHVKMYAKAQIALKETLDRPRPDEEWETRHPDLTQLLSEASLAAVIVPAGSGCVGKLLREIELRTRAGASVVAIDRGGASVINPGPDEEVRAGDRLLLLGTSRQIDAARERLVI